MRRCFSSQLLMLQTDSKTIVINYPRTENNWVQLTSSRRTENNFQQTYAAILYGANYLLGFPNFELRISCQRHSSQIVVSTSGKQRSILGLHMLELHAYLWGLWNLVIVWKYARANSWILVLRVSNVTSCWIICGHKLPLSCDLSHTSWH